MSSPNLSPHEKRMLAAAAWAEVADLLDRQLSPLGLCAIEALAPRMGEAIIDVGCGAGQTTLQIAARVGSEGKVIGVDIAPSLLQLARKRASGGDTVAFIECDAGRLMLPDGSIDAVYSRFGVMAFADPVQAFANFRRMLRMGGRLAFICWRSLAENELDKLPLRAAQLEDRIDPTPFSFAEPAIIDATLKAAGFGEVSILPHDAMVSCGDLDTTITVLLRVGALGKIIREDPTLRARAEPRVRAALAQRCEHGAIALNAASWIVTARA